MKNKNELKREIFALDVDSLPNFIDNKGEVIVNLMSGSPTLAGLMPLTGAKANTRVQLNILNSEINWETGDCVNNVTGDVTSINPRYIDMVRLTDREELCLDKLDAKLPMIMSAGARNEDLPFANQYIDLKVNLNSRQLEKLAWRGDTISGLGNLSKANGYLEIANSEVYDLEYYSTFADFASDPIGIIDNFITNRSDQMFESDDFEIYMELSYYSILAKKIRDTFGYNATGAYLDGGNENQDGQLRMNYPGTNITIVATPGLNGSNVIFATMHSNLRYATDLENDKEDVELYFDKYHKQLVSDIVFTIGFQYEFPEKVMYLVKATDVASVTVAPGTKSMAQGTSTTFTATVTSGADDHIVWSITDEDGLTIDQDGVVTVGASVPTASYTVTATSLVNPAKSGTATLTVT